MAKMKLFHPVLAGVFVEVDSAKVDSWTSQGWKTDFVPPGYVDYADVRAGKVPGGYEFRGRFDNGVDETLPIGLDAVVKAQKAFYLYSDTAPTSSTYTAADGSTWPVVWVAPGATTTTDTTAPTPGTLAVTTAATTADLTVSGASDAGGLHASPYSFTRDNGTTWTAFQAGTTYQYTGLTASTSYTFQHRVRDAAGNISVGTAVTASTTAAATGPTVLTSDAFTGADGNLAGRASDATLGGTTMTWASNVVPSSLDVVAGQLKQSTTVSGSGVELPVNQADVRLAAKVVTVSTAGDWRLVIRATGANPTYPTDYIYLTVQPGMPEKIKVLGVFNATSTVLGTWTSTDSVGPGPIALQVVGNTVKAEWTDSAGVAQTKTMDGTGFIPTVAAKVSLYTAGATGLTLDDVVVSAL